MLFLLNIFGIIFKSTLTILLELKEKENFFDNL